MSRKEEIRASLAETACRYYDCLGAVRPVAKALEAMGHDAEDFEATWNPKAHVEITLTVAECIRILEVERKYGKPLDGGGS